jgi:hypothetical protein
LGFWRPNERAVQRQERSNRDPQANLLREFPNSAHQGNAEVDVVAEFLVLRRLTLSRFDGAANGVDHAAELEQAQRR